LTVVISALIVYAFFKKIQERILILKLEEKEN